MIEYRVDGDWRLQYRRRRLFGRPSSEWKYFKKGETKSQLIEWMGFSMVSTAAFFAAIFTAPAISATAGASLVFIALIVMVLVFWRTEKAIKPFLLSPMTIREAAG